MKSKRIEAMDIVGLSILERQTADPKEKKKIAKAKEDAIAKWKEDLWHPKCPHCGKPLK